MSRTFFSGVEISSPTSNNGRGEHRAINNRMSDLQAGDTDKGDSCQLGNEALYRGDVREADAAKFAKRGLGTVKLLTDGREKDPVLGFCHAFIARHAQNWPPTEDTLADEFIEWFAFKLIVNRDGMKELCWSKGINLSFAPLPQEIKGVNCSFVNKREIIIAARETVPFGDLHTLFHEFREMLEHAFAELGYPTIKREMFLEVQADHFATACRIAAFMREFPSFIAMAANIEKKWARYLVYGIAGIFAVAYCVNCIFLLTIEDSFSNRGPCANVTYVCNAPCLRASL